MPKKSPTSTPTPNRVAATRAAAAAAAARAAASASEAERSDAKVQLDRNGVSNLIPMFRLLVRRTRRLFLVSRAFNSKRLTTAALEWSLKTTKVYDLVFEAARPHMDEEMASQPLHDADETVHTYTVPIVQVLARAVCSAYDSMLDLQHFCEDVGADRATVDMMKYMSAEFCMYFPQLVSHEHAVADRVSSGTNRDFLVNDKLASMLPLRIDDEAWTLAHAEDMGSDVLRFYAKP